MYRIAYVSTASLEFSDDDLRTLLIRARDFNSGLNVTGCLLYRNGRFIQTLEGAEVDVRRVFAKVLTDPRHTDIHVGASQPIEASQFADWTMGYLPLSDTVQGHLDGYVPLDERAITAAQREAPVPTVGRAETLFDWLFDNWLSEDLQPSPGERDGSSRKAPQKTRAAGLEKSSTAASTVVSAIFDAIMADVRTGALLPGDRVNDQVLAKRLGTSRTPVREALQKLRELGVIEASAGRFTRIAIIGAEQARQSIVVLIALYSAILTEVVGRVGEETIEAMRRDRVAFGATVASGDSVQIAACGATFYLRLVHESGNDVLQRAIQSVIHVVTLASPHLDSEVGIDRISESQEILLEAVIAGDLPQARRALEVLVPREPRVRTSAA